MNVGEFGCLVFVGDLVGSLVLIQVLRGGMVGLSWLMCVRERSGMLY